MGIRCLEERAEQLELSALLFSVPAAAFAGSNDPLDRVWNAVESWRGAPERKTLDSLIDPEEKAAIEEIEREMAEQNPWINDPELLDKVWGEHGTFVIRGRGEDAGLAELKRAGIVA